MNTFIESLASTESRQVCDTLELMLQGIWYLVEVYYIIPSHIISLVAHTVDIEKSSHCLNWDVKSPVKLSRLVTLSHSTITAMPPCSCTDCCYYTFLTPDNQLIYGKLVSSNTHTTHSRKDKSTSNADQVCYHILNSHQTNLFLTVVLRQSLITYSNSF